MEYREGEQEIEMFFEAIRINVSASVLMESAALPPTTDAIRYTTRASDDDSTFGSLGQFNAKWLPFVIHWVTFA